MTKEEKIYLRTLCPKCSEFIDIEYVDEELQSLRAWKAKARPCLGNYIAALAITFEAFGFTNLEKQDHTILTELLGSD